MLSHTMSSNTSTGPPPNVAGRSLFAESGISLISNDSLERWPEREKIWSLTHQRHMWINTSTGRLTVDERIDVVDKGGDVLKVFL